MHTKLSETLSKYKTTILVGGGTGGHVQPILTIASELKDKELLWIGGKNSNEEQEAKKVRIPFKNISTLKLSTTKSPKIFLYPLILTKGIIEARNILKKYRGSDTCVFSKGGPGSVAIGIAAWSLSIPLYIHESDTIPGRSNRILGKFATQIFVGFERAKEYFDTSKCEVIGQILSASFVKEVIEGRRISSETGLRNLPSRLSSSHPLYKEGLQWKTSKTHILVICGSQGAKSIFEAIIAQFENENPYEWIIALGKLNSSMKKDFEKIPDTQAVEWISQEDIAHLLTGADLAITRGSATTLAEIDAFSVKKIIIPLPYSADDHQYWNAKEYEKMGDILLEQKNLSQLKSKMEKICQQK